MRIEGRLIDALTATHETQIEALFDVVDVSVAADNLNTGLAHWSNFKGSVLSLAFIRGNKQSMLGTALMVAPGIALATHHVIEKHRYDLADGSLSLIGCGASAYGLDLWRSWSSTPVNGTDLVLISFDFAMTAATKREFGLLGLSERVLRIGEKVTVLGFRPIDYEFTKTDCGAISFAGNLRFGLGGGTQIFPDGRDSAMLAWPCFENDCPAVGAMSGGPVFDIFGQVVGVLTTSFSSFENTGPFYASFISNALYAPVSGG